MTASRTRTVGRRLAPLTARVTASLAVACVVALGACSGGSGRPEPTQPPSPTGAGDLDVVPQQLNGFAIPGQEVVLLVTAGDVPTTVGAQADHATATVLGAELADEGDVAEVVVVPDPGTVGQTVGVTVTVTGTTGGVEQQATMSFDVVEGQDDRAAYATELRDRFVPWLAATRPELGIDEATSWRGTMVSPQWLVVSHYLFFSEEWEMHVEWHIMIPPDDWARVDLRRRFVETTPSEAFEISSVTEGGDPHPYPVPEAVWR